MLGNSQEVITCFKIKIKAIYTLWAYYQIQSCQAISESIFISYSFPPSPFYERIIKILIIKVNKTIPLLNISSLLVKRYYFALLVKVAFLSFLSFYIKKGIFIKKIILSIYILIRPKFKLLVGNNRRQGLYIKVTILRFLFIIIIIYNVHNKQVRNRSKCVI